ncbi:substrate-binding domain-containing protein [Streptomyces sp. NPDC003697]
MRRFDPRGRVNRALLVGVSRYDHTKPTETDGVPGELPAVQDNVDRLSSVLCRGGVFDKREITVCRSPSLDRFSDELRTAAHEAEGLLLCYFAGHGAVTSAGDELFLQMRNARVVAGGRAVFPGAAQFTGVLTELAGSRAERVVVILDCCYAGNAAKIWHDSEHRQRILLLMSVQANRLIDAGGDKGPTPFTAGLADLLDVDGEVSLLRLFDGLRARMAASGLTTTLGDAWEPQHAGEAGTDVLLSARTGAGRGNVAPETPVVVPPEDVGPQTPVAVPPGNVPPQTPVVVPPEDVPPQTPPGSPGLPVTPTEDTGSPGGASVLVGRLRALAGAVVRWAGSMIRPPGGGCPLRRVAVVITTVLTLAALSLGSYAYLRLGDDHTCAPPLELRVLTDPDLEETVRAAADAYLTSGANTTGHGCRRTGITVYSAGAAGAVGALRRQTGAWQEPQDEDTNPQRDVGPQPDVWIPASTADVDRVVADRTDRVFAELQPYPAFVYSPVVLAVPQDMAGDRLNERVGRPLSRLVDDLRKRNRNAEVRRPDPELTGSALLATVGLYGPGTAGARVAEQRIRPAGPPAPTSAALLCALPEDTAADTRTAALVPEFLLRSGVDCAEATREKRTAEYPTDVPALTPAFVRVRWDRGDLDAAARDDAVGRFHAWLTGEEGLAAFRRAGFRSASDAGHPLLDADHPGKGVLRNPGPLPGAAEGPALDTALERYRSADGPGRVLFLLDSSGSMTDQWQGPSGGPGLLKHSLGGLGDQDEYGVWSVYGTSGDRRYDVLLRFDRHRRADAERLVDGGARVRDAEADPHGALLAALADMAGRGRDDERPQLIVYVTDDEDHDRLTGDNLKDVLGKAALAGVPVDMVSLAGGACDRGRPDALIAGASGGRCLDAGDDLGTLLHDEVARVGTGED